MEGFYSAGPGGFESCAVGAGRLIQITPQIRILVAIEAIDARKGKFQSSKMKARP
jgi:hypothetical protein